MKPGVRPVFREMLDRIKAGEANGILCWHLNRLARNPLEWGELQQLLADGVIQCVKTPEREYHPEDHSLLIAVESSMAAQYSRDLRRDVQRGCKEKALQGWYPYKPKAGYELDPVTKELQRDEFRSPLLRRAIEHMLTGDMSVPQVLQKLNAAGYKTPRTKSGGMRPMSRSSLYRFFTDPFYTGRFTFEGDEIQGKHEPLLTETEFAAIQRILGRPMRAKPQKYFHTYAGLMRCGVCGCQITAETHVKRYRTTGKEARYVYYHCTGRKGCPKTSVTEPELDHTLLKELDGRRLQPEFVSWALEALEREEKEAVENQPQALTNIAAAERSLSIRLDRLFEMREDGELSKEEFLERKAKYTTELTALRKEATEQEEQPKRDRERLKEVLVFRRDAYRRFANEHPEERRRIARALASDYVLTQGKLSFTTHIGLHKLPAFEPPKNRTPQVRQGQSGVLHFTWRAMLAELRKTIGSGNETAST